MKTTLFFVLFFAQTAFTHEILNLNATYQVPVSSDKFSGLATFEMTNYQIITNDQGLRYMTYTLPDDLTGEDMTITMPLVSEIDGKKLFESEQGSADCTGKWVALNCGVSFKNLEINQNKVISHLVSKYGYKQETKNRYMVSRIFSNDPIGIVKTNGIKEETLKPLNIK